MSNFEEEVMVEERRIERDCLAANLASDENLLDYVGMMGLSAPLFMVKRGLARVWVDGVEGIGATPSKALADVLSKILVPEVQS